jgi:hypothetical protein
VHLQDFQALLANLFGEPIGRPWPKPYHLLQARVRVERGELINAVAKDVGALRAGVRRVVDAEEPLELVLGLRPGEVTGAARTKVRQILGQLLLGKCAELAFEEIYRAEMHSHEFQLKDLREGRTDTDYRVFNGQERPVYRVNIKFHGSRFRRAPELVGLDPKDCFALATYKICSALQKQDQERLPYFFAVVGVADLTGEAVGQALPADLVEFVAYIHQAPRARGKRDFEDAVIDRVVHDRLPVFVETYERLRNVDWYILSARRADKLLRELLFDRVFALRVRGFAQQFRAAELDMHFSLSRDLIPLKRFLATLREEGATKVATLLERGEY